MPIVPSRLYGFLTLVVTYAILSIIYFLLVLQLGYGPGGFGDLTKSDALVLTADILTGESVVTYSDQLAHSSLLWMVSWIVRVIGWLAVPVVVATLIGRLLVRYERRISERRLETGFRIVAEKQNYSPEETRQFVAEMMSDYNNGVWRKHL